MTEPSSSQQKRQRRLWITLGEVVGVLALVVAGLNYWDSHRERTVEAHQQAVQAKVREALVMTGTADADGARVALQPLNPGQAIQVQRYLFPTSVLDHAMEVSAARPQIDRDWVARGLKAALAAAHAPASGEAALPVGVITTYVQDGDTLTDHSLYRVGFAWRSGFLTGPRIILQGLSLQRRNVAGGLQTSVDRAWRGLGSAGS